MKLSRICALSIGAMCLMPGAHAEQHGAAYGTVKAVFDYCARVDSRHRTEYDSAEAMVLASVAKSHDSGDFRAAYDQMTVALEKLPQEESRTQCAAGTGFATIGGHGDGHDDDGHDRGNDKHNRDR